MGMYVYGKYNYILLNGSGDETYRRSYLGVRVMHCVYRALLRKHCSRSTQNRKLFYSTRSSHWLQKEEPVFVPNLIFLTRTFYK